MPKIDRFYRIIPLFLLSLALLAGGAAAQIQLAPPNVKQQQERAKPAQLQLTQPEVEQPAADGQSGGNQNGGNGQPEKTPAAEAGTPAPEPPDLSIVDRATGVETGPKFESWTKELNDVESQLNGQYISHGLLDQARTRLDTLRGEVNAFIALVKPKVQEAKAQLDNLGSLPQGGEPPQVASQRNELQKMYGSLLAAQNLAESTYLRAGQLLSTVQEVRRRKFTERLFERVPEALSGSTWTSAPREFSIAFARIWREISAWWTHSNYQSEIAQLLFLGLLLGIATSYASLRGVRHFRKWDDPSEPPYWRRSTSAVWVILLRVLPYAAVSAFLYYSLRYQGLFTENVELLAYSAMRSLLIVAAVSALVTTVLAPRRPHWRLLPMDDRSAQRIRTLVIALAALYSFTLFVDTVRYVFLSPFTLTIAQSFVSSLVIALLVLAILITPRKSKPIEDAPELGWVNYLRWPLWGVAGIILVTTLTGYIGLSRFVSGQLIVTGTILALLYLLMVWIEAFGESMGNEEGNIGGWLKQRMGLDEVRRQQLALPVTLMLKLLALTVAVPLVLLQWGFDWADIRLWGERLFFGFKIGQTQVSISTILMAVFVFVIGYLVARFVQGWLDRRVLETAKIAGGTRHSIRTAVGYVGIVIAALFAISYTGLDLSNIALVAGALSVGIGLGLQGVVNNFVSGLILLAERPIKVGDWIVVGNEEGIVKKISVRATELETFDRSNVLIPNSAFITGNVKNWTLHNYSGRISIPVGVHYQSNPRQVRDLLLQVAAGNPHIMKSPEPYVYFGDFGADSLEFTLYAFTYDITRSFGLKTELRIEIFEALREAGIEIPYRQTDIHLRDSDWLKEAFHRQMVYASQNYGTEPEEGEDVSAAPAGRGQIRPKQIQARRAKAKARRHSGSTSSTTPNGIVQSE